MDHELIEAFNGVYLSSREILKNKQRHLYCNMLDLLQRTCKATGKYSKQINQDDLIEYWLGDILPLIFDADASIQTSAIAALEQGLFMMDIIKIHQNLCWSKYKTEIMSYPQRLHKLRDSRNHSWYKIWCILVRLLDRDILRGASTINSFLFVVEQGFRNTDNTIRAEAFFCWRLLIQIFAEYNELCTPKRMKLICIPLKSSQPKSVEAAEIKLRVWWFLIVSIGDNLYKFYDTVVDTFLSFCFGTNGVGQQFESVGKLGITCFTSLLLTESNEYLELVLRENELENSNNLSQITKPEIMQKYWNNISNYGISVIKLAINEIEALNTENRMLQLFLRLLLKSMFQLQLSSYYEHICDEFLQMLPKYPYPIKVMLNMIASDGIILENTTENLENHSGIIMALMKLLFKVRGIVPPAIFNSCIERIFYFDSFKRDVDRRNAIATIIEIVQQSNDDESYEIFEIKLAIWSHLSKVLLKNFDVFENNVKELINWLIWPLQMSVAFIGQNTSNCFTKQFCTIWKELLEKFPIEHQQSLNEIKSQLQIVLKNRTDQQTSLALVDAYVSKVLTLEFDDCGKLYDELLDIFKDGMTELNKEKNAKDWLTTLRYFLSSLSNHELTKLFNKIKTTLEYIWRLDIRSQIDNNFLDIWKKEILEIFRTNATKKNFIQINDMFKSNESFVIIPNVWSLNPEKLTERQKERFAERADIPALYNDMSLSQDSTIQPWTPKKIVIAKDITIGDNETNQNDEMNAAKLTEVDNFAFNKITNVENLNTINKETKSVWKRRKSVENNNEKTILAETNKNEQQLLTKTINNNELKENDTNVEKTLKNDRIGQTNAISIETNVEVIDCEQISNNRKELSPKKPTNKSAGLLSPPGRKLINNTSSPTLRSKPPAYLTGRGAQLINMIRNRKSDSFQCSTANLFTRTPPTNIMRSDKVEKTITSEIIEPTPPNETELLSTPLQIKDVLIFSKRLPSPSASPSASILKRKLRDSIDDISIETSTCKKKRVSFHDPPVSVTKEYEIDVEENKNNKPKRCLILSKTNTDNDIIENRHILKRRSKVDSLAEIEKYTNDAPANDEQTITTPLPTRTAIPIPEATEELNNRSRIIEKCIDADEALKIVMEQYSLDTILEKYMNIEEPIQLKTANLMTKFLSNNMNTDVKIKSTVLETLSENHSKDFLDHAVQENLSSVVCDRLNLNSILDYILKKSKINTTCRTNLLKHIIEILKHNKSEIERIDFIKNIYDNCHFTDANILDLITKLMQVRDNNTNTSIECESAADSSSNL